MVKDHRTYAHKPRLSDLYIFPKLLDALSYHPGLHPGLLASNDYVRDAAGRRFRVPIGTGRRKRSLHERIPSLLLPEKHHQETYRDYDPVNIVRNY